MSNSVATSPKTKGITALALGIASVVFAWLFAIVGLIAGIVAVVFGFLSRKSEPAARNLSLWGIILGFVGIVLSIIFMILGAVLAAQILQNMPAS